MAQFTRKNSTIKIITGLFILILVIIILVNNLGLGLSVFSFVYAVPYGDKISHFFLVGILTLLINLALDGRMTVVRGCRVMTGTAIVLAVVTLEEFSQIFLSYRGFSLIDLAANYFGVFVFNSLASVLINRISPVDS